MKKNKKEKRDSLRNKINSLKEKNVKSWRIEVHKAKKSNF